MEHSYFFLFNFEIFHFLLSTHNDNFDYSMWTPLQPQRIFLNLGWKRLRELQSLDFGFVANLAQQWALAFLLKAVSPPRSKLLSDFQMYSC